ncbi:MAG TPA: hypothetical protein VFQ53_13420 [Kofleriaceae bacterium]|nr:hypothetical protein [Kofleriaceae bacterium]
MHDPALRASTSQRDYPPHVLHYIEGVRRAGGQYFIRPLFFAGKYVGYRVRFRIGDKGSYVDVTGGASFAIPFEDAIAHREPTAKPRDFELARQLIAFVTPRAAGAAGVYRAVREQLVLYRRFRHLEGGVVV